MQRIGLFLFGVVSLVAGGVIMDRGRVNLNSVGGLGLQTVQGIRGGFGDSNVWTRDELWYQKFILDIVRDIYAPLQQQDLLVLDDRSIITNEDLYLRPLTQEMHLVLNLIKSNQMLGKQAICNPDNDYHVQQAAGYYRLLVTARDFETFKRLVVYGRQNINTELFVYSFILSLGERQDTRMLVIPALHEILVQQFVKDSVIDQVRHLDTGFASVRPQLMDVMGMGRGNFLLNSRFADQQQQQQEPGFLGFLNKSQFWMPWRELHKQIALRKTVDGTVVQQDDTQINKMTISLPGNGLLSQDIGLKTYIGLFFGELVMNKDTLRNINRNNIGIDSQRRDNTENVVFGKRGQQSNYDNVVYGNGRARLGNEYDVNSQYENIVGGRRVSTVQADVDADRYVNGGKYLGDDEYNQNIYGGQRKFGLDADFENVNRAYIGARRYGNTKDEHDYLMGGRRLSNNYNFDEELGMERNTYTGRKNYQEGQRGINTVSVNDPRLLFVGRRRTNPMGGNRYDEDELISGGRRVITGDIDEEGQKSKYYNDSDDVNTDEIWKMNKYRYMNTAENKMRNIYNDENNLYVKKNRDINSYDDYQNQNQQLNDNVNRYAYNRGVGADDFINVMTRGPMGPRQTFQNEQDSVWNRGYTGQRYGERLDMNLPTTNINDERLLYVNRRKLNAGNIKDDIARDVNDRYNTDYPREYINTQRSYLDEQKSWNMDRSDKQSYNYGVRDVDSMTSRGETRGRRLRRSIINQEQDLGQTSTINGRFVLYTLQQLVARLNIERIALGQPQLIDTTPYNIGRGIVSTKNWLGNKLDVQTINNVENILQRFNSALQQRIGQISVLPYNQQINEIGLMLAGKVQELGLTEILYDVLKQTSQQQRKGLIANMLENEAAQYLLAGIVKIVEQRVQQVFSQRQEFINTSQGININNVEVDKFQTYIEQTDVDLTNLLRDSNNYNTDQQGNKKIVVGRVPRLNHKSFNIKIDVTSDRQQQVVVRNLLVPKVDGQNNIMPWVERRQNVVVLDITTVELQEGRNTLKLNSKDITITGRDTTPLTKIYKLVMQALNGDTVLQHDLLAGQSTLLPHRLLLPRGRTTGLPMQLITVITPIQRTSEIIDSQRYYGLNNLLLDNLPFYYPFHCDIADWDRVISMSNLVVKDVQIYHEDTIQTPFMY